MTGIPISWRRLPLQSISCSDVLEIDAAKYRGNIPHLVGKIGIIIFKADRECIDTGKLLEEDGLPLHDRYGCVATEFAQASTAEPSVQWRLVFAFIVYLYASIGSLQSPYRLPQPREYRQARDRVLFSGGLSNEPRVFPGVRHAVQVIPCRYRRFPVRTAYENAPYTRERSFRQ